MNFLIWLRRWKAIFTDFVATYRLNMLQGIYEDVLKSMAFAVTILLHDAAYQFLRRGSKLVQPAGYNYGASTQKDLVLKSVNAIKPVENPIKNFLLLAVQTSTFANDSHSVCYACY